MPCFKIALFLNFISVYYSDDNVLLVLHNMLFIFKLNAYYNMTISLNAASFDNFLLYCEENHIFFCYTTYSDIKFKVFFFLL